ncbi:MAG: Succinyl-diaminopimelate desuccinylase [Acidimicrobiaceae bacterium]|nr:Succinyl-diaminopimelate desuccinylase [Acidimicrobiaceae bacterium]
MTDLLARAAELVDIASVSHDEREIADFVERSLRGVPGLDVTRIEDNVVARTHLGRNQRLLLAGHLDTVPPAGNEGAKVEGNVLHGLGSADMKGGLAVLVELARTQTDAAVDATYVFYACEEVAQCHSGLKVIEREQPELLAGDAAILAEPTAARVEAGCQGVLRVTATVRGKRAHSARPWVGVNAIHRLAPLLERVAAFAERRPVLDGCEYRETLQAVAVAGGVAGNVVPDEASLTLSHRFAPDRDAREAFASLEELLAPALDSGRGDDLVLEESAPAAPPMLGHPLLAGLVAASGQPARAKIAWTDVAFFAQRSIPAANYGPGDPLLAHTSDERVERSDLEAVHASLARLLSGEH